MPEVVETDVSDASGIQDFLMDVPEGVRVVHGAGLGGGEQVWAVRMFFMLQYQ